MERAMSNWTEADEQRSQDLEYKMRHEKGFGYLGRETDKIVVGEFVYVYGDWRNVISIDSSIKSAEIKLVVEYDGETMTLLQANYMTLPTIVDPSSAVPKSLADLDEDQ